MQCFVGKPERKDHLGDLSIARKVILKPSLKKQDGRVWTGITWVRTGTGGRLLSSQ
jgi:hypothetical protein